MVEIDEALQYLETARRRLEEGTPTGFADCLSNCRNALVSTMKTLTGTENLREGVKRLKSQEKFGTAEEEFIDAWEGLLTKLYNLLSKKSGAHPPLPDDENNAVLGLEMTEAVIEYLTATYESKRMVLMKDYWQKVADRRETLIKEVLERGEYALAGLYPDLDRTSFETASRRTIWMFPVLATYSLIDPRELSEMVKDKMVMGFSRAFPRSGSGPKPVQGGVAFVNAREDGYTEVQSSGLVFYRELMAEGLSLSSSQYSSDTLTHRTVDSFYSAEMLVKVCLFTNELYKRLKLQKNLMLRVELDRVKGRKWASNDRYFLKNDTFSFEQEIPAPQLRDQIPTIVQNFLDNLHWSLGLEARNVAEEITQLVCRVL